MFLATKKCCVIAKKLMAQKRRLVTKTNLAWMVFMQNKKNVCNIANVCNIIATKKICTLQNDVKSLKEQYCVCASTSFIENFYKEVILLILSSFSQYFVPQIYIFYWKHLKIRFISKCLYRQWNFLTLSSSIKLLNKQLFCYL